MTFDPSVEAGVTLVLAAALLAGCGASTPPPPTATVGPSRTPIQLGPTSTASATPSQAPAATATATLIPIATGAPEEPALGPQAAPVELLLYLDYDCDPCLRLARELESVQSRHPGQVRLVVRQFPLLEVHDKSGLAAAALLAARQQDAFWDLHQALVDERETWRQLAPDEFTAWLTNTAVTAGLNGETFAADMDSATIREQVQASYARGLASGIPGAPFLLINRQPYLLGPEPNQLEAVIRLALLQRRQFESEPPLTIDPGAAYSASIAVDQGEIRLQLHAGLAPRAVNSFVFLSQQGWYDGTAFHRVVPGRLVEAGDPSMTGLGHAGYHFPLESQPGLSFDQPGRVALDNDGPGTNSARFLVALDELPALNEGYTIFATVTEGLELIQSLSARDPIADIFQPPELQIETIEVNAP